MSERTREAENLCAAVHRALAQPDATRLRAVRAGLAQAANKYHLAASDSIAACGQRFMIDAVTTAECARPRGHEGHHAGAASDGSPR